MRMAFTMFPARGSRKLWALVACSFALLACSKDRPASAEAPTAGSLPIEPPKTSAAVASAGEAIPAQAPAAAPQAAAPAGSARFAEANFELSLSPQGSYEAGKPAAAQIVLDAKPPFHVNEKYPYKFKPRDEAGLSFASAVVGKDNMQLEKARATMTVPFTVQTSGKHTLAGQFSFSVCTDDKCLIEKRDLSLLLEAK